MIYAILELGWLERREDGEITDLEVLKFTELLVETGNFHWPK